MTDAQLWQDHNDQYLAASLEWLRRKLAYYIEQTRPAFVETIPVQRPVWTGLRRSRGKTVDDVPKLPPISAESVAKARAAILTAGEGELIPALRFLAQRFGLTDFEQEVLLLCSGMELDPQMAEKYGRAQGEPNRPYPTFTLALHLFDNPEWDALTPQRPLRFWRLIEIHQPPNTALTQAVLRLDERILNFIKGINYIDDRLSPFVIPMQPFGEGDRLPPSQEQAAQEIARSTQMSSRWDRPPLIQLVGPDTESKQLVAAQAAAWLNLHLFRLPVGLLPAHAADLENLARMFDRENRLFPMVLYLDASELERGSGEQSETLSRFMSHNNGVLWLDTPQVRTELSRSIAVVDVDRPAAIEQREAWAAALERDVTDPLPNSLAGQFNLNLPVIQQVAQTARQQVEMTQRDLHEMVWSVCLARTSPQLGGLAQRLEPKATWDDLVLPDEQLDLLQQIAGQVGQRSRVYDEWGFREKMNRGFGISALFTGESGTGKTMAAEVIANELNLHLYRIDLSSVVSKYIGETEKNLRRLFDAAEHGGVILFFDEADALAAKRTDVKDSHDRYANIETNYLLQRMESYRGLAILATNERDRIDKAFLRRLRFIVHFLFPGPAERALIWSRVFPASTPTQGLDYAWLARLNLAGGSIHNAAINAAFTAAQTGQPVTMPIILAAARTEFRKLERPYNESDLRVPAPVKNLEQ